MPNDSMYALKPEAILNIQQCQGLNKSFIETQIALIETINFISNVTVLL